MQAIVFSLRPYTERLIVVSSVAKPIVRVSKTGFGGGSMKTIEKCCTVYTVVLLPSFHCSSFHCRWVTKGTNDVGVRGATFEQTTSREIRPTDFERQKLLLDVKGGCIDRSKFNNANKKTWFGVRGAKFEQTTSREIRPTDCERQKLPLDVKGGCIDPSKFNNANKKTWFTTTISPKWPH